MCDRTIFINTCRSILILNQAKRMTAQHSKCEKQIIIVMEFNENTPIACLTVGQFRELIKNDENKKSEPKQYGKYLTRRELCELTGLALNTINMKVCRREIPGMRKVGGKSLFETETILKWIESGAVKTRSEILNDLERGGEK